TLRVIGGFVEPKSGSVLFNGKDITALPPHKREVNTVFQKYALFPHLNVFENVAFGLRLKKTDEKEIRMRVLEMLEMVGLKGYERRNTLTLSGGQQQRIALARAIVTNPKVMLLDEPLSNLDPKLRESMRFEIKELQKKFNFTIIFVTHDQSEAMALSDRMMVMDQGNIVQIGTPTELYSKPNSRFVHSFLGQSTFINVMIENGKIYPKGDTTQEIPCALPQAGKREMILATRPNAIDLNRNKGYKTKIEKRIFLTDYTKYMVRMGDQLLQIETPHWNEFQEGEACYVNILNPMWYEDDGGASERERVKRQLI
ncbi:MAG: ABC transporter ATP-binding protein, partial [Oscillospiraceae bacterium]